MFLNRRALFVYLFLFFSFSPSTRIKSNFFHLSITLSSISFVIFQSHKQNCAERITFFFLPISLLQFPRKIPPQAKSSLQNLHYISNLYYISFWEFSLVMDSCLFEFGLDLAHFDYIQTDRKRGRSVSLSHFVFPAAKFTSHVIFHL